MTLEKELLDNLVALAPKWVTPMILGGTDASKHSPTLARMVKKGWVERRRRGSLMNMLGSRRGSYEYRITKAGRIVLRIWNETEAAFKPRRSKRGL